MRVLVACEFSGIVRDAFAARGHDAWSCDIIPTEAPGNHHQCPVESILGMGWDMMIACPPCTYLTYAGTAHWNNTGRKEKRAAAMVFFRKLYDCDVPRVAVENPFGLPCQEFRKPDQIINPFDFGQAVRKRTCLWLKNLPILWRGDDLFAPENSPTPVPAPEPVYVGVRIKTGKPKSRHAVDCNRPVKRNIHFIESLSHDGNRAHERSRFFPSIAAAMAQQWG